MTMDEEWIHWRNVWAIFAIVFACMLLIFDCRYTECPPLIVDKKKDLANTYVPGGPTVAINFGIGDGGVKMNVDNEQPKIAEPPQQSPKNNEPMFGVDQKKNKYSLPVQQNNQNDSNNSSQGGLAPPIY